MSYLNINSDTAAKFAKKGSDCTIIFQALKVRVVSWLIHQCAAGVDVEESWGAALLCEGYTHPPVYEEQYELSSKTTYSGIRMGWKPDWDLSQQGTLWPPLALRKAGKKCSRMQLTPTSQKRWLQLLLAMRTWTLCMRGWELQIPESSQSASRSSIGRMWWRATLELFWSPLYDSWWGLSSSTKITWYLISTMRTSTRYPCARCCWTLLIVACVKSQELRMLFPSIVLKGLVTVQSRSMAMSSIIQLLYHGAIME